MTHEEKVDAALAHAEHAMVTRTVEDLALALCALDGALELSGKLIGCEQLLRDCVRTVQEEYQAAKSFG